MAPETDMGVWRKLVGLEPDNGSSIARRLPERYMDWSRFDDHRRVQVVGAEYHQPALLTASKHLVRVLTDRCEREATLLREPTNAHDSKAVQVMVQGRRVGYLKAGSARSLSRRVEANEEAGTVEHYPLLIRMKDPGFFQAHLQIPYASELLKGYKNPKGS